MADPAGSTWDLHPETEAESLEPDDEALTLPQDGAPSNVSLTAEGQILREVRELRALVAGDVEDRDDHRALVRWIGVAIVAVGTLILGAIVALGLAALVILAMG